MIAYVFTALLCAAAVIAVICTARALAVKPTAAKTARISAQLGARELEYGGKLGKMIACNTVSERGKPHTEKFLAHHRLLEQLFPRLHSCCERHTFGGSLLFRWRGEGKGAPIVLMSHQDVVEASGEWKHPPFGGQVIDGKVWGRGAVDTKGNLFCMLQAVEELIESGATPPCDVYLASSDDEEIHGIGAPATVDFLKRRGVRPAFVLDEGSAIMDGSLFSAKGVYGMVGMLEKGYANVRLVASSKGGHASTPAKNSPLVRLGKLMVRIEKKSPFRAALSETMLDSIRFLAPDTDFPLRLMLYNLRLFGRMLPKLLAIAHPALAAMVKTTIAFTTAEGSDGINVLPRQAYVTASMRFMPHQDMEESIEILARLAKRYGVETQIVDARPSYSPVSADSDAFRLIERVTRQVYPGVGLSPCVMTYATDARHYTEICDNVYRFSPLYISHPQMSGVHGVDENIDCASLGLGVDFFKRLIQAAYAAGRAPE